MRSLPFTNVAAAIVFFAGMTAMGLTEIRPRRTSAASGAPEYDRKSKLVVLVTAQLGTALSFAAGWFTEGAAIGGPRWVVFAVGMVLVVAGIGLRRWAITTLGQYFTHDVRIADDQPVVDRGPYGVVRHPAYASSVVSLIGIGLALGNWLSLAAAVLIPLVGYVWRIRVEEGSAAGPPGRPLRHVHGGPRPPHPRPVVRRPRSHWASWTALPSQSLLKYA